jgi:hypothetical protein
MGRLRLGRSQKLVVALDGDRTTLDTAARPVSVSFNAGTGPVCHRRETLMAEPGGQIDRAGVGPAGVRYDQGIYGTRQRGCANHGGLLMMRSRCSGWLLGVSPIAHPNSGYRDPKHPTTDYRVIPEKSRIDADMKAIKKRDEEDPETARRRSRVALRLANLDREGIDRVEKLLKEYGA